MNRGLIAVICFFAFCIVFYVPIILYYRFGWFKFWYHDVLKWHHPNDAAQWNDGCSQHAICKHCGEEIMQDSQGNWF